MSINLYIVRHGQTYINKYDRVQGWTNAPLTPKGINDGEQAGERLATLTFNNVYSSDLARAVETANITY
jgi:probable phosphoglycerate mutase